MVQPVTTHVTGPRTRGNQLRLRDGEYASLWHYCPDGYEWRADARLVSDTGGEVSGCDATGPWLVPRSRRIRRYPVLQHEGLHRSFAQLRDSDSAYLDFANHHGLLGLDVALAVDGMLSAGESLCRWRNEAVKLGILLALWDLVETRKTGPLGQIILWPTRDRVELQFTWKRDNGIVVLGPRSSRGRNGFVDPRHPSKDTTGLWEIPCESLISVRHSSVRPSLLDRWTTFDLVEPARFYVCDEINKRLRGHVSPQVLPYMGDEILLFPDSLLAAFAVMFVREISGKTNLARCPECEEYFHRYRRDMRYCSAKCRKRASRRKSTTADGGTKK